MTPLPPLLPDRARRALTSIGVATLEGVAACRVDGLSTLPGIDADALAILDGALDEHGWGFAESSRPDAGPRSNPGRDPTASADDPDGGPRGLG